MSFISCVIIAIGLSIDSFVASVSAGIFVRKNILRLSIKIAVILALFQGVMPFLGWLAGNSFKSYITTYDHWVAFIMLSIIGGKMIYEGIKESDEVKKFDPTRTIIIIGMGVATSIDALIIGVGFGILQVSIIFPVVIIGITTFLFSILGVAVGRKFGKKYNSKLEIFGGAVLFLLGIKILIEHTCF